jgi:hypothetical protein
VCSSCHVAGSDEGRVTSENQRAAAGIKEFSSTVVTAHLPIRHEAQKLSPLPARETVESSSARLLDPRDFPKCEQLFRPQFLPITIAP